MNNKYYKIPTFLLSEYKISANSRMLYGIIFLMCQTYGYCYASNEFLAHEINVSRRTISRLLSELKDNNLIKIIYSEKNVRNINIVEKNIHQS